MSESKKIIFVNLVILVGLFSLVFLGHLTSGNEGVVVAVQIILGGLAICAIVLFLYGAFLYSSKDESKRSKGTWLIYAAAISLVVILAAWGVVKFRWVGPADIGTYNA